MTSHKPTTPGGSSNRNPFARLWFKLTGAFALVIVVGVIVTVVITRSGAATQFAHFMLNGQMVRPARLQQELGEYYQTHQGWSSLDQALDTVIQSASDGGMSGMMGSMMGMYNNRIQIVDNRGAIVGDTDPTGAMPLLSATLLQQWPIESQGTEVGMFRVEGMMMGHTHTDDERLLSGVTRAVLVAGLVAGGVALLLAGLLVRQITMPLGGLARASARIAAGDLQVRVPVQSHDELGELADTFNQMASSLETQETLRRNLMADIAHELRTPLAGIQGNIEALQDGVFPLTPENLETIHEEVLLLNRLVEDLRTLANAEAGKLSLDSMPVNLAELAQRQLTAFHYRALAQGVELTLQSDGELPIVQGDQQRLGQVLTNLLDNALRHTPNSGAVQVRLTPVKNGVQLSIRDSGEGIPAADLPHVFDRFYRADRSRSRETGGSGLGLAIARQLIEAHHGHIEVNSPPQAGGNGSEFSIFLPRG